MPRRDGGAVHSRNPPSPLSSRLGGRQNQESPVGGFPVGRNYASRHPKPFSFREPYQAPSPARGPRGPIGAIGSLTLTPPHPTHKTNLFRCDTNAAQAAAQHERAGFAPARAGPGRMSRRVLARLRTGCGQPPSARWMHGSRPSGASTRAFQRSASADGTRRKWRS